MPSPGCSPPMTIAPNCSGFIEILVGEFFMRNGLETIIDPGEVGASAPEKRTRFRPRNTATGRSCGLR